MPLFSNANNPQPIPSNKLNTTKIAPYSMNNYIINLFID